MLMSNKNDLEKLLEDADGFERNRLETVFASERRAWKFAGSGIGIAILALVALVMVLPLKSTVVKVIRVNDTTGAVDVQRSVQDEKIAKDELVIRSHVRAYVYAKESYARAHAQHYFDQVYYFTPPNQQQKWAKYFNPQENPNSPLNVYGDRVIATIKIKSLSFLATDGKTEWRTVQVRFKKTEESGLDKKETHWVALVPYRFVGAPKPKDSEDEIADYNPLGFQVDYDAYRVDLDREETKP